MKYSNLVYTGINGDWFCAKKSFLLSRKEIDNISWSERIHYFSNTKAEIFLKSIGRRVDNNNLYMEIKRAIRKAKKQDIIVPYEKAKRGRYILIHFPFYNGTMELKGGSKYDDIYWWWGLYRNLRIYACGNKKNRLDDVSTINTPLWNPSGSTAAREFFDDIKDYILTDDEKYREMEEADFFDELCSYIHSGTMRGPKHKHYQGWYEMLLRCDQVGMKNGNVYIFGSPIFVTYETQMGYGWYPILEVGDEVYYREWNKKWTGHICKETYLWGSNRGTKFNLKKRILSGFNLGYRIIKDEDKYQIIFNDEIIPLSKTETVRLEVDVNAFEKPLRIDDMMAVCYSTRLLKKYIDHRNTGQKFW